MSRPSPLSSRLSSHALLIAAVAFLAIAPPARAGFGDLVKKAKEKAAKATGQKTAPEAATDTCKVEFDAVVLELTDARIEGILAAFKAAGDAGAGRPALVEKLNKVLEEKNAIWEKQGEQIRDLRNKRSDVESCYHDGYAAAANRRTQEYMQRALADPKLLAKYAKVAQQNNAAGGGDSASLQRASEAYKEETMPTREDSLEVKKACGPIPPKSAAEARYETLEVEERGLNDKIAQVDEKVAKAQAEGRGMDLEQWGMALERIRMYLSAKASKAPSAKTALCGFSKVEIEALEKHLEQLRVTLG
jgi:uncharacterized coiled-coil protein SlyX